MPNEDFVYVGDTGRFPYGPRSREELVGYARELYALLEAGREHGIVPCGLGARDTLRTEMGYPLHGQDISLDTNPVEAGLSWAVGWLESARHPCSGSEDSK